jgi:hypothetical protein
MARKPRQPADRIGELEDALKERDRRIAELRREVDEQRDLIARQDQHVRDASDMIESWIQAFAMERREDGTWMWKPSFVEGDEWFEKYAALLKDWNRLVPEFNAAILKRNVGRPLAASDAQRADVLRRRKRGESLRAIADEMSLGLQTVRTIIDQGAGVDRTTHKHLERIDPDRARQRAWRAKSQSRKALPKKIAAWEKTADELRQEAKGLR